MSLYIEKDKLLEWLEEAYKTERRYASYCGDHSGTIRNIIDTVKEGTFDWHGESE